MCLELYEPDSDRPTVLMEVEDRSHAALPVDLEYLMLSDEKQIFSNLDFSAGYKLDGLTILKALTSSSLTAVLYQCQLFVWPLQAQLPRLLRLLWPPGTACNFCSCS